MASRRKASVTAPDRCHLGNRGRMKVRGTILAILLALRCANVSAAVDSPVADAVMTRNPEVVRSLLQKNANANLPQADGTTALHWAARWDDIETARALIRASANPRTANRAGATPLFLAT